MTAIVVAECGEVLVRRTYLLLWVITRQRDVTQVGRVLALGARCRRFESCHLDQLQ